MGLLVQDNTKKRAMNLQSPVVVNEAELPKPVHEEIYSRARRTNHLSQRLLTDSWDYFFRSAFLAEVGKG